MLNKFSYGFWIWSTKLDAVLSMLSRLIRYEILEEERGIIKIELRNTSDEEDIWMEYQLIGLKQNINIKMAYDTDNKEIIHLRIETDNQLKDKIETLDMFQALFTELKE